MSARVDDKLKYIPFPTDFGGKTVLDLGCYDGGFSQLAKYRGASKILKVDINPFWKPDIVADLEEPQDFGKWDIVLCMALLHHVRDVNQVLVNVKNSVNKGGYVFFEIAIGSENIYKKHKKWGDRKEQAWYWVPNKPSLFHKLIQYFDKVKELSTYKDKRWIGKGYLY